MVQLKHFGPLRYQHDPTVAGIAHQPQFTDVQRANADRVLCKPRIKLEFHLVSPLILAIEQHST